jgi:hypothetical protein
LQVELKGGRIDWRAKVESRSGRGEERIVTCALHTSPLCLGRPDRKEKKTGDNNENTEKKTINDKIKIRQYLGGSIPI